MKKLLFSLIFLFLLIGSVSAWSYDETYTYGQATAYAEVTGTYPVCEGQSYGNYCIGDWYVDVSYVGDKFYVGYSYTSWSPQANEIGYTGISEDTDGKKILELKQGHPVGYILCSWDRADVSNGDWAWASICGGYLIDTFQELTTVECYQDVDCPSGQYCKKVGSTTDQDWKCEIKICNEGDEQCSGKNLEICSQNQWINNGVFLNKCGVECTISVHCPPDQVSDTFCDGNSIVQTETDNSCSSYECVSNTQDVVVNTCTYACQDVEGGDAICVDEVCTAGEKMCSEGNVLICSNNVWVLDEECDFGCQNGVCKSFSQDTQFYWILGIALGIFILVIIIILVVMKKK